MFTVVMPLFNKAAYVTQAIQSVLSQEFQDFELLVIDDGSEDNSVAMVENFSDRRLHLIRQQHSGVSAARNLGISHAKNQYIAFLDADDYWDSSFLSTIALLTDRYHKHSIFATGRTLIFDKNEVRYTHKYLPANGEVGVINYYEVIGNHKNPIVNASNSVIRKSLLLSNNMFDERLKNHEDHELWLRLSIDESVIFINKPLSFYRKNIKDSASLNSMSANEFLYLIGRFQKIKNKIKLPNKVFFSSYYNRFLLLSFLKYRVNFTTPQEKEVYTVLRSFLSDKYKFLLKVSYILPRNTYSVLMKIKNNE